MIKAIFADEVQIHHNLVTLSDATDDHNQIQTNEVFSDKWKKVRNGEGAKQLEQSQKDWFLELYGFNSEHELREFLESKRIIVDAGCGLGYKAAWFAKLSPNSLVLGIDFADSINFTANKYKSISNLFFAKGDIANTGIKNEIVDFVLCDQVIMHTTNPDKTFKHLCDITRTDGQFGCYVYRKKALPRELIDEHFREHVKGYKKEELWEMSNQLTELGKTLSKLKVSFTCPDIPMLDITGGEYDIQRFIYWNFLKCFWREEWPKDLNIATNFDWYSPSNAKRYSKEEFLALVEQNSLQITSFHEEKACYSGRFLKN